MDAIATVWHGRAFRIGDNVVDPARNRVTGPSGETALQPKVMDVLCALAERPGEVLSRSDLIDRVWGKEFGADESLTRAISQLRKAFADTRDVPQVVETISKRGYRLMVAPEPLGEEIASPPPRPSRRLLFAVILVVAAIIAGALLALKFWPAQQPPMHAERTGIVVTVEPFASDDRALPVGGLDDELGAELARSPLIRARSSAGPPGTDALPYRLRGDIHRLGDKLRISAELDDATTGEVVWGETFERPYDAQFSARDSVIATISRDSFLPLLGAAKKKLSDKKAESLRPWEATLIVTWVTGDEGAPPGPPVEDSYWLQRHALAIDPDFAPAHALFAELAAYHALFHPPFDTPARREVAQRHADRALELAPYDAEVLYQLSLYYRFSGDRDRAEAMLKRVLALQPNHPLGRIDEDFLEGQCSADAGPQMADLRRQLDELAPSSAARWVALAHLSAMDLADRDFDQARSAAIESRKIIPMTWTAYTLAAADAALGRNAEAAQVLADHRREWPNMNLHYFADHVAKRWCLGGPRTGEARQIFGRLANAVQPAHK